MNAFGKEFLKSLKMAMLHCTHQCFQKIANTHNIEELKSKLGANLLTQIPEITQWLCDNPHKLDLASIAYLDGEKHVRVSMAMDTIMSHVSEHKNDSSLMYMCTPTDVYAVPEEVIEGSNKKFKHRSKFETVFSKGIAILSLKQFFKHNDQQLIASDNGKFYGIADCLVVEQALIMPWQNAFNSGVQL